MAGLPLRTLAALAALAVVAAQPLAPVPAGAQAYIAGPWFEFNETAGLLSVDTPFYRVEVNLTRGFTIQSLAVKYAGSEAEAAEAARYLPSMFIYAYSNLSEVGPGSAVVEVKYDNETYTANYPGFLAVRPWSAEIVYNDSEVLVVRAEPGPSASVDISPAELEVYAKFYRNIPVIEYRVVFRNPAGEPVEIYSIEYGGTRYGPIVELVAGDREPPTWNQTITYSGPREGLGFINVREPQYTFIVEEGTQIYSIALVKADGYPQYLVAARPLTQPGLVQLLRGYVGEVKDPIRARLAFGLVTLGPGESWEARMQVVVAWGDPGSLALAGLGPLAAKLFGDQAAGVYEYNKTISDLEAEAEDARLELNRTRAELDQVRAQVEELEARVGEVEGLLGLCQADLNATQARLDTLRAAAGRTALVGVASFIIGIAAGIAGFKIAGLQELLERVRQAGKSRPG